MRETKFVISKQFSEYPAGRYRADGDYSGEVFREDYLAKMLAEYDVITIDLDGAMGYGSSFLEEAFGGLARVKHIPTEILHKKFSFKSDEDPSLVEEIWSYIDNANS